MRVRAVYLFLMAIASGAVVAACAQAQPAPTPAKAPLAPTTALAPTKAPLAPTSAPATPTKVAAVQPTSAPAKKVDFPSQGRSITYVVGSTAGSPGDVAARVVAPLMEKELGVPVQVVNKTGAGTQVGLTEIAQAKPDGYTLGATHLPTTNTIYLDPERKAVFTRESFIPVAGYVVDPDAIAVKADSPFKSAKDLVDAAKASPEKVKLGVGGGKLAPPDLGRLLLEKAAGVKFGAVMFAGGGAEANVALLGGHVDAAIATAATFPAQVKSGELRILGVMDREESPFFPGVRTFAAQGYNVNMSVVMGISVPARTPKEVVDVLGESVRKAMQTAEFKQRMESAGLATRPMDGAQFAAQWAEIDVQVKPLMSLSN